MPRLGIQLRKRRQALELAAVKAAPEISVKTRRKAKAKKQANRVRVNRAKA